MTTYTERFGDVTAELVISGLSVRVILDREPPAFRWGDIRAWRNQKLIEHATETGVLFVVREAPSLLDDTLVDPLALTDAGRLRLLREYQSQHARGEISEAMLLRLSDAVLDDGKAAVSH